MKAPLFGLVGKARSGKDSAAEGLTRAFGYERYAFADPLKAMLEAGFPGVNFRDGDREKPIDWLGKSPRQLMQLLGTEWGRTHVHPELWVLMADQQWQTVQAWGNGMVVTDVRFNNEAEWILSRGGMLIEILRPEVEQINAHVSENALTNNVPMTQVTNNGTLAQLHKNVVEAVFRSL